MGNVHRCAVLALAFLGFSSSPAGASPATFFYVSPGGSDAGAGTRKQPFASLGRARDAVRALRARGALRTPVEVIVRGGTYALPETLVFDPRDSGTPEGPVTYAGAPGEKVVISGGVRVTGWQPYKGHVLRADLKPLGLGPLSFKELYYRGAAQPLARVPNVDPRHPRTGGFTYATGEVPNSATELKYDPAALNPGRWAHPQKAVVDIFTRYNYTNGTAQVKSVDLAGHVLTMAWAPGYVLQTGDRFFVKNVFEELDAPGEWYLDEDAQTLHFWPPDDSAAPVGVTLPRLTTLLSLRGDASHGQFVEHLAFRGFEFRCAAGRGIDLAGVRHCTIARSAFTHIDGCCVFLGLDCHQNTVAGCDMTHTGHNGVSIVGEAFDHARTSHNTVANNHIYDFSRAHKDFEAGVTIKGSAHNVVSHNLIHDCPRSGVYIDCGNDNVVEYNHIYRTNLETEDTGAIYTCTSFGGDIPNHKPEINARSRGNIIRGNLIHDTGGYGKVKPGVWQFPHFCWGIYLDLATSGTLVCDNVVYNTFSGAYMVGGGQDNVCENNIFVDGAVQQIQLCNWGSRFPMVRNRVERNIIACPSPDSLLYNAGRWAPDNATFDCNLLFAGGKRLKVSASGAEQDRSWDWWRAQGMDRNSVVADPLFVGARRHDYRLKPGSPAAKIGFRPIDPRRAGLFRDPDRASWPPAETDLPQEVPVTNPGGTYELRGARPRPQLAARRGTAGIAVDGDVSEWPWADRTRVADLRESWDGSASTAPPSQMCAAWDDEALFLAVRNPVTDAAALVTTKAWGSNDGVEVAFQVPAPATPTPLWQLYGYPDGRWETFTGSDPPNAAARGLAAATTYRARIGPDHWSCEWRIPWAAAGIDARTVPLVWFSVGVRKVVEYAWVVWRGTGDANYVVKDAGDLVLAP